MKTFKILSRLFAVFGLAMMFAAVNISAATLDTDDFDAGTDGWSGTNVTWGGSSNKKLLINQDNVASKTFSLGASYANLAVAVTMTTDELDDWEDADLTQITVNGVSVYDSKSSGNISFNATADANGDLKFTITPNTNSGVEDLSVDTIKIDSVALNNRSNYREFSKQRQDNIYGDMQIIGNSVMVESDNTCAANGTPNNDIDAKYATRDATVTATSTQYFNTTSADLVLPKDVNSSHIVYAYLYWQGRTNDSSKTQTGKTVKIKPFGETTYSTITSSSDKFNWNGSGDYQGVQEITSYVKTSLDKVGSATIKSTGYNKPFWVADVYAPVKSDDNDFGAWSMVVVYKNPDPAAKFRSITMYDGYLAVFNDDKTVPLSGFLTPKTGVVDAKFLMFGGEGDISYSEGLTLTKTNATGTPVPLPNAPGTPSGTTSAWGSSQDIDGVNVTNRNPNCQNTIGVDIRTFSVGTNGVTPIIGNNQTSTTVTLKGTGDDQYFPGVFAFSTELYMPKLCYDYSFKQDGAYLKADNTGNQLPLLTGTINKAPIETTVYIRNKEADISVNALSFFTDVNTTMFDYVAGSSASSTVNGSTLNPLADSSGSCSYSSTSSSIACNDTNNVRIGLGNNVAGYGQTTAGSLLGNEFVYAKFALNPVGINGVATVNESLGMQLNYYIQPDISTDPIVYTYILGQNLDLCPPSVGYTPVWGTFNVVDAAAGTYAINSTTLPVNNLRTQVSREPFAVNVAAYGKHTDGNYTIRPIADVNTTVLVEMIDNDAFHDANASCANPDSNVSAAIFVPLTIKTGSLAGMMDSVPTQDKLFHNFAVKNGSFRIWYFNESDGKLITDWTPTGLSNANKSYTGIQKLYKGATHTVCSVSGKCGASGETNTTKACFECIKENYAKPLCSRDNFSVRPESYDLRIFDVNKSLDRLDSAKDATKVDLSTKYQYAPTYPAATGRMNIAAGYDYRYDMNATGHDANLTKVPGYTRYFNGANTDYNATMIWDSAKTNVYCNDVAGRPLSFYVANGEMLNSEGNQSQVGEYQLNVIDKKWTAVDWDTVLVNGVSPTSHHTTSKGFEPTPEDCTTNSTTTVKSASGKIGCTVSSDHSGGGMTYKDHELYLKPAKLDISTFTYGLGMNAAGISAGGTGYVYDSNLSIAADMPMSIRTSGSIRALGDNDVLLSNFVDQCFAVDLNVSIENNASGSHPLMARIDTNSTFSAVGTGTGVIGASAFLKANNGASSPVIRLNVDRDVRVPIMPTTIHYNDINMSCADELNCSMDAMTSATPNTAKGTSPMNFDVTHAYGRVIPSGARIMQSTPFTTIARYEVYKTPTLLLTSLLGDPSDVNWNINALHSQANGGSATVGYVEPTSGSSLPTSTTYGAGVLTYAFNPFTIRQSYQGHINTEGWLWYGVNANAYLDPSAGSLDCLTHPCFNLNFGRLIGNTGSAKTESKTHKANKATSSTGWSTTSEYAPAVR